MEHDKSVTGFNPGVRVQATNPGHHARVRLDKTLRTELYKPLPDCLAKNLFLQMHQKFDLVRKLYKKRNPTDEEKALATAASRDFIDLMCDETPFGKSHKALMHVVGCHLPKIYQNQNGTGSVLDLSSSGLESSNKTERHLLHHRTLKTSLKRCLSDLIRASYLRGTYRYKLVERKERSTKLFCNLCGSSAHKEQECWSQMDTVAPDDEEAADDLHLHLGEEDEQQHQQGEGEIQMPDDHDIDEVVERAVDMSID